MPLRRSASPMFSAGMKRTTWSWKPHVMRRTSRASAAAIAAFATDLSSNSAATIAPKRRISRRRGCDRRGVNSSTMISPIVSALATRFSSRMTWSVARPDAQETGLPPKVEPCVPVRQRSMRSRVEMTAPSGIPPPSAFAAVITSGITPNFCAANHAPVRPIPVWTSSNTRSAPIFVARSRSDRTNDAGAAT